MISVVIPIYKVEAYLERCIKSVLSQTYKNLEIILVDDGSPDNCPRICDTWAQIDNRIRVIHKKNGGLSDARNAGLAAASGEYIGFIDSDDWIHPQMYEKLHRIMQKEKGEIAACAFQKVNGINEELMNEIRQDGQIFCYDTEEAMRRLITEQGLEQVVWNKLYKRELLEGINFAYGKYNEDEFWTYQIIARAKKVITISYVGYFYFQRSDSIIGMNYSLKRLDGLEAKAQRQEFVDQKFPELSGTARLNLFYSYCYAYQCILRCLEGQERKIGTAHIKDAIKRFPLQRSDYKSESKKQKFWILLYKISLTITCRLRNRWKIGL